MNDDINGDNICQGAVYMYQKSSEKTIPIYFWEVRNCIVNGGLVFQNFLCYSNTHFVIGFKI